eukprot:5912058-Alexandrium_andersonii.AAC.1
MASERAGCKGTRARLSRDHPPPQEQATASNGGNVYVGWMPAAHPRAKDRGGREGAANEHNASRETESNQDETERTH